MIAKEVEIMWRRKLRLSRAAIVMMMQVKLVAESAFSRRQTRKGGLI